MDRQSTLLLALGTLFVASVVASVAGWILFARLRAARPITGDDGSGGDDEGKS